MRLNLLARLKKLDGRFAPNRPLPEFRCGFLKTLPPEFEGERHIVTVASPAGEPWEFEERPGRGPTQAWDGNFTVYLTR